MPALRSILAPACVGITLLARGAVAQQADVPRATPDQIHPRTMIALGIAFGDEDVETSAGSPGGEAVSRKTEATHIRLRAEHFFESEFGFLVTGFLGVADGIDEDLGSPGSSWGSDGLFAALAYRETVGDWFRLPVRFGPFFHRAEQDAAAFTAGAIERSMIGVRLSVGPEVILSQSETFGRLSEFSAFAEFSYGVGPAWIEDDAGSESTNASCVTWEVGVRYRFVSGLFAGLSWAGQRYHVDTATARDGTVFFGAEDEFSGVMLTAGVRF